MAKQNRISVLIVSGSVYYRSVGEAISKAVQERKSWSVRLAGDMGGQVESMLDWHPDGIITNITQENPFVKRLLSLNVPLVNFSGALPDSDVPTVRSDDQLVAEMAADYLLDNNLKHFAFWVDESKAYIERRGKGFFATLRKRGVPDSHLHALPSFDASDWQSRDRIISEWLLHLPKPVGLLAGLAQQAYYLCEICRDAGIDVPNEVALLGVDDDHLVCEMAVPPLSSIRLATQRIGQTTVDLLADILEGNQPPDKPVEIAPLGVVSRGSTNMLAIDDPDIIAAVRYIRKHATDGINIPDILAAVPLSRRSLERKFNAIFNRSPLAEIRRVQIEQAKYLLLSTDLSIPEVARQSGITNADYFATVFNKQVGMPPSHFRRDPVSH